MENLVKMNDSDLVALAQNDMDIMQKFEEAFMEDTMLALSELLSGVKGLSNYSYGFDDDCQFNLSNSLTDKYDFVNSLKQVQGNYGILSENKEKLLDKVINKYNILYYLDPNNPNFDLLEDWIYDKTDELLGDLSNFFNRITTLDCDVVTNYFPRWAVDNEEVLQNA